MDIQKKDCRTNQEIFFNLLKNLKIEKAIELYVNDKVQIDYNNKKRSIPKQAWIRYLRKTILSKFTKVVQFKIEKTETTNFQMVYNIHMICKKPNGTFDLTEVCINDIWEDNHINKMQYKLISH